MERSVRGALYGLVLGDCVGRYFEYTNTSDKNILKKILNFDFPDGSLEFSDATQMSQAVLKSLFLNDEFLPKHLAQTMTEYYFSAIGGPFRGYDETCQTVFNELNREPNIVDVYAPAVSLLKFEGPSDNSAAKRCLPLFLYSHVTCKPTVEIITDASRLTHAHGVAYFGAQIIGEAFRLAFDAVNNKHSIRDAIHELFQPSTFTHISDIIEKRIFSAGIEDSWRIHRVNRKKYHRFLERAGKLNEPTVSEVEKQLGNSVCAKRSVCTAIFIAIRSLLPIRFIPTKNIMKRCLAYACLLGGNSSAIASMACSIVGIVIGADKFEGQRDTPENIILMRPVDINDTKGVPSANDIAFPLHILAACKGLEQMRLHTDWLVAKTRSSAVKFRKGIN